jgi:Ser/Thr protein kinase RdoA (MazF antagonist)
VLSDWKQIAESKYGLTRPKLLESRKHHSQHFFIQSDQGKFVMTCSEYQPERMAKPYQFKLIECLQSNGYDLASLPVPTQDGEHCHLEQNSWWKLAEYAGSDPAPSWESTRLITQAAHSLAALHKAGRQIRPDLHAESDRGDLGWYYMPSTRWPDHADAIASKFRWEDLNEEDTVFVKAQVDYIRDHAQGVKALCTAGGAVAITHQDYRPINIRVLNGDIAEIWDFDLSVVDFSLYDVAFASLQYGGRECLFPDISLNLGGLFLREYIKVTDKPKLFEEQGLLHWFLIMVVLRRLLMNYGIGKRIRLLRMVESWDWQASSQDTTPTSASSGP